MTRKNSLVLKILKTKFSILSNWQGISIQAHIDRHPTSSSPSHSLSLSLSIIKGKFSSISKKKNNNNKKNKEEWGSERRGEVKWSSLSLLYETIKMFSRYNKVHIYWLLLAFFLLHPYKYTHTVAVRGRRKHGRKEMSFNILQYSPSTKAKDEIVEIGYWIGSLLCVCVSW